MRRRMESGIIILSVFFALFFIVIIGNYFTLAADSKYAETAALQSSLTITIESSDGNIYDRNMNLLVNAETKYIAVAVPQAVDMEETAAYVVDKEDFYEKYSEGVPFTFECTEDTEESEGLTVFCVPVRYSENQIAQHIIGYTSQGEGVSGIEYAYDSVLRGTDGENSVTYASDGYGRVLIGEGKSVVRSEAVSSGVVASIDSRIQRI